MDYMNILDVTAYVSSASQYDWHRSKTSHQKPN